MKSLKQYLLTVTLLLIAGYTSAATFSTLERKDIIISEADYNVIASKIFQKEKEQIVESQKACCKIYNSKYQLVYMSRDEDDAHLKQLKQHCNLIMKTESSSYYLLVDR
jgi:hypothetical protein